MKLFAYSPDTGEFINTETPADWMGSTDVVPLAYTPATESLYFRNGGWEIVAATPILHTVLEQITQLEAMITDRRLREAILGIDSGWLAGVNGQIAALRGQL